MTKEIKQALEAFLSGIPEKHLRELIENSKYNSGATDCARSVMVTPAMWGSLQNALAALSTEQQEEAQPQDAREAFEKWANDNELPLNTWAGSGNRKGQYCEYSTGVAWKSWQASRATPSQDAVDADAIALLKRVKRYLMHVRRFSFTDTLDAYRRACTEVEGDIDVFLAAMQAQGAKG